MRFLRRRPSREEWNKDVQVMLNEVLPLCQSRPTVYNELGKYTQQWISEIAEMDEIIKEQVDMERKSKSVDGNISCKGFVSDEDSIADSATINEEDMLSYAEIEWSLPNTSETPDSIEELQQNYDLLKSLNTKDISRRTRVRRTIRALIEKMETDIALYKDIRHKKALRSMQERDEEQDALIYVLDQTEDYPYVYNQVLVRLHSLGPSKSGQHERWKKTLKATSTLRWSDVQCLDELMDNVPTDLQVRDFLHVLRENCRAEAKALTRLELQNNPESPPNIRKLLSRSNDKNDIRNSPLCNYHVTHTIT